jgi:lysophospholipase L1-like esterase
MKKILFLVLLVCSTAYGAYSTAPVGVIVGTPGIGVVGGYYATARTYIDRCRPIKTAGTLSKFQMMMAFNPSAAADTSSAIFMITRGDAVIKTVDITAHVNAARTAANGANSGTSSFLYDTSLTYGTTSLDFSAQNIVVAVGDCIGIYFADRCILSYASNTEIKKGTSAANDVVYYAGLYTESHAGDLVAVNNTYCPQWEAYINTANRVLLSDTTGYTNGGRINVPSFTTTPEYISIENITVPFNKTLKIEYFRHANSVPMALFTFEICFDGTALYNNNASLYGGTTRAVVSDQQFNIANQSGTLNAFELHLWFDPNTGYTQFNFSNIKTGKGGQSTYDIKRTMIPKTRQTAAYANEPIREIRIVGTDESVSVGNITIHREPILMISDSFGSTKTDTFAAQKLARVGVALSIAQPWVSGASYITGDRVTYDGITYYCITANSDSAFTIEKWGVGTTFTYPRYVINGGISGDALNYTNKGYATATEKRWNDTTYNQDLCAFRNVVVVIVNGACLNDIGGGWTSDSAELAATNMRIASNARNNIYFYGYAKDVVLSEMIPYAAGTPEEQALIPEFNKHINLIAADMGVPLAKTFDLWTDLRPASGGGTLYEDAGTHPNPTAGSQLIAAAIARAYEQTALPVCGDPNHPFPTGDFDLDCKVTFEDIAIIANHWLECNAPECD